jgi:hypothetical protein
MHAGIRHENVLNRRRQIKHPLNIDTVRDAQRSQVGPALMDFACMESHPEHDRPLSSAGRIAKEA